MPCNDDHPDGTERLYTGGDFNTRTGYCETYGHDLLTGAVLLLLRAWALKTPSQVAMIMVGVALLTVAAWAINRALLVPVPVWSSNG